MDIRADLAHNYFGQEQGYTDGTPEEEVAFEAIDVRDFGEVLIQAWGDWWGGG